MNREINKSFGKYKATISGDYIRIDRKQLFGSTKRVLLYLTNNYEDLDDFNEMIEETIEVVNKEILNTKDIDYKNCCKFIISSIEDGNYLTNLFGGIDNVRTLDLYLNNYYKDRFFDMYPYNEKEKIEKKILEWKEEGILKILKNINFSDLFEVYDSDRRTPCYLNLLLELGFEEVNDYIFNHKDFYLYLEHLKKIENNTYNNPLIYLLENPKSFNRYAKHFGEELFSKKIEVKYEYYERFNIFEYMIKCSEYDLRQYDMSLFEKLSFNGCFSSSINRRENPEPFFNRFIFKNIFYFTDKERCLSNLKIFFNHLKNNDIKINLDVKYNNKLLLEYAKEQFDFEMYELLIENGADTSRLQRDDISFKEHIEKEFVFYKKVLDKI